MQDPRKRLAGLERMRDALADDVATAARMLDAPVKARDADVLQRKWRAIAAAHRAVRSAVAQVLAEAPGRGARLATCPRPTRDLVATARAIRADTAGWSHVNPLVERQIRPAPTPLFAKRDTTWQVMDDVSALFAEALHTAANPQKDALGKTARDGGMHRDIPLSMQRFSDLLGAARRTCLAQRRGHALRFLDVGCGGGTKVLAATTCFATCVGLEYQGRAVRDGTRLLDTIGAHGCTLMQGDACTFSDYAGYDTIYFYRPLRSREDMIALEARIFGQARPGTVLLAPDGLFTPGHEAQGVQHLTRHVYVTGMDQAEADALHDAACDIGTALHTRDRDLPGVPGLWEPLLQASQNNGYGR